VSVCAEKTIGVGEGVGVDVEVGVEVAGCASHSAPPTTNAIKARQNAEKAGRRFIASACSLRSGMLIYVRVCG
jgi:hypothetical protein